MGGQGSLVEIDGGVFTVCSSCCKLGRAALVPTRTMPARATERRAPSLMADQLQEELDLVENYHILIKTGREKMGLSQEEMGRKINEKLSVIKHLESKRLKPDLMLARKVEHLLKIQLYVKAEE